MDVTSVNKNSAASGQSAGSKSLTETYQTFLSLLTSQIRNQDPLSPMDTTDWTNQLVQYNAVEQQLKANTYLESLVNQSQLAGLSSGVGYIGKSVTGEGDTVSLTDGKAAWNVDLGADAKTVVMNVKDANGKIVHSETLSNQRAGSQAFNWDGIDDDGVAHASGGYTLSVSAVDAGSAAIASTISVSGKVTAVSSENGETVLMMGQTSLPLNKVSKVEAAS